MSDRVEEYIEGPLKGMASVRILVGVETLMYLKEASREKGRPVDELVEAATAEAALNYAKSRGLVNNVSNISKTS